MIEITPVPRALVPVDSAAADALSAPNYDEFQSDREIRDLLRQRPDCLLRVTMAHCDVPAPDAIGKADSEESLARAAVNMARLRGDARVREVRDVLWVCEITTPAGHRQIGLGGCARTDQIRTPERSAAPIIRNEGIREPKARGRARLIERIGAIVDGVNNAVDDATGAFEAAVAAHAEGVAASFVTTDPAGNVHRVWVVQDAATIERFRALLACEPRAYVADGNHRSAAAAMLGHEHFLAVFFPAGAMHIAPYNRLLARGVLAGLELPEMLRSTFDVDRHENGAFQPALTHEIGLYRDGMWWRLRPRPGTFDPKDAAQDIDADIVQHRLFADLLGIADARDERLTFVGNNHDAAWLQAQVDAQRFDCAVTLPAVTMKQFIRVCLQDRLMPPKSTWFEPKILSGLVMMLLE
jgi:uncharacterized protein (DUF1015 family)